MQSWGTVLVGAAVAIVAFMQWRTAHQKVVLDLFDRRIAVYEQVVSAVEDYLGGDGNLSGINARQKLWRARAKATFLFGHEVVQVIEALAREMLQLDILQRRRERADDDERAALAQQAEDVDRALLDANVRIREVMAPYVRMDQKLLPTPRGWLIEKWNNRPDGTEARLR